jgi:chemotaxis protein MotB
MARASKQAESDQGPGAPEWMVTFSDCMTLLLTFFVLLLSFSSFDDDRIFMHLKVIYSKAFTSIAPMTRIDRDSLLYLPPVKYITELDKGSETVTSEQGAKDGLMKEMKMTDLNNSMAFLILSKKVFWAQGSSLSPEGRRILDTMVPFLKSSPDRIVISEDGPIGNQASEYFGLPRAWAVMEYLTKEQKLGSYRFSVSTDSALALESLESGQPGSGRPGTERTVEIVLLQRSIYN